MAEPDDIPEPDRTLPAPHPRETAALYGQDAAIQTFRDRLSSGRLHHGWLLTGPEGIGKATFAWMATRHLLASGAWAAPDPQTSRQIASLGHPRLLLLRRPWDADKKRLKTQITVEEVRKLNRFFGLSAADGGWRVAIVDAADEMNPAAANALLKLLEEPPERCIFFLVCHQPGRLLPTIRSRTIALPFQPLGPDDLSRALLDAGIEADGAALHALSGGSVGEAVRLASGGGADRYAAILDILHHPTRMDRAKITGLADAAADRKTPETFGMILRMTELALTRAAKIGAGGAVTEAMEGEIALLSRLAPHQRAAQIWADLVAELSARTTHATAVNIDPASVILDMFLKIEAAAARIA